MIHDIKVCNIIKKAQAWTSPNGGQLAMGICEHGFTVIVAHLPEEDLGDLSRVFSSLAPPQLERGN
jgi:hypothetical protein